MRNNPPPDVMAHTDYRAYLREVVAHERPRRGGLRGIARDAGLRSAAMLSMVVHGKRNLARNTAERLADSLSLSGRRKSYFVAMTQLATARTEAERAAIREKLLGLRGRKDERLLAARQHRCLSQWHYAAIYVMVDTKGFRRDAAWIAEQLGRGITAADVKQAIGDLLNLQLLKEEDGRLVPCHTTMTTADEVRDVAVRKYHENMLALAKEALDLPLHERELSGLTISASAQDAAAIRERIRRFRHELNEEFGSKSGGDRIYQIHMQFFPLSKTLTLPEEKP